MGRLTLNMLLSFAQFEREIAGERIRDKIAASKAKGMWMGGTVPLGYDVHERKLVVNAPEAATVRLIFERYTQLGSVALLRAELNQRGIVSKRRHGAGGRLAGGQNFSRGALYLMLQNHLYRGEIKHKEHLYAGQHEAIIDPNLWTTVQERLETNRHERSMATGAGVPSLLAGLIVDAAGDRMTPTHAVKTGKRYRYYVSAALITGKRNEHVRGQRIPAGDIEGLVLDRLRAFFASDTDVSESISPLELDAPTQRILLQRSAQLVQRWSTLPASELYELVRSVVARVTVGETVISVHVDRSAILTKLMPGAEPIETATVISVLSIAARLRRAGKGTRLVIGDGTANEIDESLVSLIGRAVRTREALLSGNYDSIDAMAKQIGIKRDHLTVLVRLSYLAPQIVGSILAGRQPVELTPTRLIDLCKDLPHDWRAQRTYLGFGLV